MQRRGIEPEYTFRLDPWGFEYAQFELGVLRETLELTDRDPSVLQLGGFHGDVKKNEQKKASGYESHHIPAQSVFSVCADELPAIALTNEDHKKTDSYAGKRGIGSNLFCRVFKSRARIKKRL